LFFETHTALPAILVLRSSIVVLNSQTEFFKKREDYNYKNQEKNRKEKKEKKETNQRQ
jgi:hypothetical protein